MSDLTPTNNPAPSATASKNPRDNALQSRALAKAHATSERLIQSVLTSPDLLLALAPSGFNEVELNKGRSLFVTAQTQFAARQEALGVATLAMKARDLAFEMAMDEFRAYRTTVQVNYREAERANLGASGRIPTDRDKFITVARAAYTTAVREPYLSVLAGFGFTQERLTNALGVLDKFVAAEAAYTSAVGKARAATETRDIAANALKGWMMKLRFIAKTALRDRPALMSLMKE